MDKLMQWGEWIVENAIEGSMAAKTRAVILLVVVTYVGLHSAWAFDKLPGFEGPAKQSDINHLNDRIDTVNQKVDGVTIMILLDNVREQQRQICELMGKGNQSALTYATDLRDSLKEQYKDITGDYPVMSTCKEMGIVD